jgi:hypothetical protein
MTTTTMPLLLMPPRDRLLSNAYPLFAKYMGQPMTTCTEHMVSLCKQVFINKPGLVRLLPFQDSVNPWDIEYVLKGILADNVDRIMPFKRVEYVPIRYGDEDVLALRIYEMSPRLRYRPKLPYFYPSYSDNSYMDIADDALDDLDEDDEGGNEDEDGDDTAPLINNRQGWYQITYNADIVIRGRQRRRLSIYRSDMTDGMTEQRLVELSGEPGDQLSTSSYEITRLTDRETTYEDVEISYLGVETHDGSEIPVDEEHADDLIGFPILSHEQALEIVQNYHAQQQQ